MATKEKQALDDRGLIRWQMLLGSGLIAFGGLSIPLFQVSGVLDGQAATAAFAVATGVIGDRRGDAADRGRGRRQRPHPALASGPDDVADDQHGARNGQADKNLVLTAPKVSKGQAGKSSQDNQ